MGTGGRHSIRRASRGGRRKYFVALPVLSVLFVVTALAAPTILHATFTVFDDGVLQIHMRVQQVTRRNALFGNVFGILIVDNGHDFAIRITGLRVEVLSGDSSSGTFEPDVLPDGVVLILMLENQKVPFVIPAHTKLTKQFFASITGSPNALTLESDFLVQSSILAWEEIYASGVINAVEILGFQTVCTDPASVLLNGGVGAESCTVLP